MTEHGKSRRALTFVTSSGILLISDAAFDELARTLTKPKLRRYIDAQDRQRYLDWIAANSLAVPITTPIAVCRDPDDDRLLELAVSGNADFLVTGNLRDFPPESYQEIVIVNPARFLEIVYE